MITFGDKLKKVEVKTSEPLIGRTETNKKKERSLVFNKPIERLDDEVKFKIILEKQKELDPKKYQAKCQSCGLVVRQDKKINLDNHHCMHEDPRPRGMSYHVCGIGHGSYIKSWFGQQITVESCVRCKELLYTPSLEQQKRDEDTRKQSAKDSDKRIRQQQEREREKTQKRIDEQAEAYYIALKRLEKENVQKTAI